MKRRTLDIILTTMGALLTVTLLVAGGLLMWGYSYTTQNVHDQLAAQKIYFPPASQITPAEQPYIGQYAGQQLLTGQQAEAYANHYIGVHLSEMPTYSEASAAYRANPTDANKSTRDTVFMGTTLRGLLLEAWGFSVMGAIALIAGIAAFALAFLMIILVVLGYRHFKRTDDEVEVLAAANKAEAKDEELVGANS